MNRIVAHLTAVPITESIHIQFLKEKSTVEREDKYLFKNFNAFYISIDYGEQTNLIFEANACLTETKILWRKGGGAATVSKPVHKWPQGQLIKYQTRAITDSTNYNIKYKPS